MEFTVLDVTEMLDTGNESNASAWMRAASERLTVKYRGAGDTRGDTLYVGKNSRNWAFKVYPKFREVTSRKKSHRLPEGIPWHSELLDYARGTVRAELRLYSMELKRQGLHLGSAWLKTEAHAVWERYMSKIELLGNKPLQDGQIERLPAHLRATYAVWAAGLDVSRIVQRRTFFRHRKALKAWDIDIAVPRNLTPSNVVPLLRVIEARPKGIPSWAYNTPLLAAA
jgi:II/X family phage/plasmid replication protein